MRNGFQRFARFSITLICVNMCLSFSIRAKLRKRTLLIIEEVVVELLLYPPPPLKLLSSTTTWYQVLVVVVVLDGRRTNERTN